MPWIGAALVPLCLTAEASAEDVKDRLVEAGVTPTIIYNGNLAANLSGGLRRGESYDGILSLQLAMDGERIASMPGLSGFLDVLWANGGTPAKFVGDAQGVSNIAAPPALRLYEAWLQYTSPVAPFSVLVGRYDLNTEFYRLNSASLFLNGSFGLGPELGLSGFAGSSVFPNTSAAVRLAYSPMANVVVRGAILTGAPLDRMNDSPPPFSTRSGVLLVAEAAFVTRPSSQQAEPNPSTQIGRAFKPLSYDDKVAVGAWYYTAGFNDLSTINPNGAPVRQQGQSGAYLVLDHLLAQVDERRITGFVQLGIADQVVNRFGNYAGVGLSGTGLVSGRPDDMVGIAAAVARGGLHYIRGQQQSGFPVNGAETSIELTYMAQMTPWLGLQPDLQYVVHPSTNPRVENAVVAQFRLALTF